jgi:hypothetical protein
MSQSAAVSAPTGDVVSDAVPAPPSVGTSTNTPVLITEQEVLFHTRAAVSPPKPTFTHRVSDAVRGMVHALRLPPPRPHYPADMGYLERSRMAREMDRL